MNVPKEQSFVNKVAIIQKEAMCVTVSQGTS